jgi:hypothetical protein
MPGLKGETKDGFFPLISVEADDSQECGMEMVKQDALAQAQSLDDAGLLDEKPKILEKMDVLIHERGEDSRRWDSMARLVALFAQDKSKKVLEIWFFVFLFFYADFLLDLRMMWTFYWHGDVYFCISSLLGIVAGILYTLAVFRKDVSKSDPPWMILMCGFLLPFQFHVLFLCIYSSSYMSKAHPLLHSFKLAESAIEATVSACVQSYAMIFRNLSGSDYIFTFVSSSPPMRRSPLSSLSSTGAMGACRDCQVCQWAGA